MTDRDVWRELRDRIEQLEMELDALQVWAEVVSSIRAEAKRPGLVVVTMNGEPLLEAHTRGKGQASEAVRNGGDSGQC